MKIVVNKFRFLGLGGRISYYLRVIYRTLRRIDSKRSDRGAVVSIVFICSYISIINDSVYAAEPLTSLYNNVDSQAVSNNFGFRWQGFFRNETAYRIHEPRAFTKIRNLAFLTTSLDIGDFGLVNGSVRTYYDHAYDIYEYSTISGRFEREANQPLAYVETLQQESNKKGVELNELYLDLYLPSFDLRLGKQLIVWGVLTGVRVVDEINPMDFRELILGDLLDYRIPLWSLKADIYAPLGTFEFIAIPDIRFHKPAPAGSEFELLQEVPGTEYPINYRLRNAEFGLRLSRVVFDTELSLSYFYTWDDFPTIYRIARTTSGGVSIPQDLLRPNVGQTLTLELHPRYHRLHIAGLTFRRTVAGQIVKGELAVISGKRFGLESVDRDRDGFIDYEGVLKKDHLRFGIGTDLNWNSIDFSPSVVTWYIFKYDRDLVQKQLDTTFNIFIRREFFENATTFELLGISLLNLKEVYLRPKLIYQISQRVTFTVGADAFFGQASSTGRVAVNGNPSELIDVPQRTQFFGNFNKNDRLFFECKFSF